MVMFRYDSITVSYTRELISVSMCYSQGDRFNTSLSTLSTVPTSHLLALCIVLGVVVGGMFMRYTGRG